VLIVGSNFVAIKYMTEERCHTQSLFFIFVTIDKEVSKCRTSGTGLTCFVPPPTEGRLLLILLV
jgi:hypothetical protein